MKKWLHPGKDKGGALEDFSTLMELWNKIIRKKVREVNESVMQKEIRIVWIQTVKRSTDEGKERRKVHPHFEEPMTDAKAVRSANPNQGRTITMMESDRIQRQEIPARGHKIWS